VTVPLLGMRLPVIGHPPTRSSGPPAGHRRRAVGVSSCVAACSLLSYARAVTNTIAQRDLRNDNAKVIAAVMAGETFIVTRNGEPVAELRPIRPHRRTFVTREEITEMAATGVRIDHHQFREDLDRAFDQRITG
jgi:prevent-host-death family protein